MTQGVVKNIIPAIASTNAMIAASCCNEAFKLVSMSNPCLGMPDTNNYMMYSGDEGVYTYTFEHKKKDDCPVCGTLAKKLDVDANSTLRDLIESFAARPEAYVPSK
jgi:ubiquitin-activating enzyme E1 C